MQRIKPMTKAIHRWHAPGNIVAMVCAVILTACSNLSGQSLNQGVATSNNAQVEKIEVPGIQNYSQIKGVAGFGGVTQPSAMQALKKKGFVTVINLSLASEPGGDINNDSAAAKTAGMKYIHLPFDTANPDSLLVKNFIKAVGDGMNLPVYIYCKSVNRVGTLWMIKRALVDGWNIDSAHTEAEVIGMAGQQSNLFAINYIRTNESVKAVTNADKGLGDVHMDISCKPGLSDDFDAALALLHNFWYKRALEAFTAIIDADPECSMAYWGAAMTYNHPFWDPPTKNDLASAWALVQIGLKASEMSPREKMYLDAVAALYKDAGVGNTKAERDAAYLAAMKATADKYPDDETRLFYGQMLLSTMPEGAVSNEIQPVVAGILEEIYARKPNHPGVLHYMTHVYDDPINAQKGLIAARAYSKSADAVPHAHHMPSHIFARLGFWEESAISNENAWRISEADVAHAGEEGAHRDFHALNYLQSAYIQLGRYKDAKRLTLIFKAEYDGLKDKTTAPDSPILQAKHVKGRTIFGLPDRVVYGYFDVLVRYLLETEDWDLIDKVPLVAPSRDFVAMKTEVEAGAAALKGNVSAARVAADKLTKLSKESGQNDFVQSIITIQAKTAEGFAAYAAGDQEAMIESMESAGRMEDMIAALSQPSYPAIPTREIYGNLLRRINRPEAALVQYTKVLERTPRRPKSIYGIAVAAAALGDTGTATRRFKEFLELWKNADEDRPELAVAKKYLEGQETGYIEKKINSQMQAPEWALKTTEGHRIKSSDYRGSALILVLHRGLDCILCSKQLALLASHEKELRDRGIAIVSVAPYWPIASELKKAKKSEGIDFPLSVDPERVVFREYDSLDGDVTLHGTFLIDAKGMLRWSAIGEKPFYDIEKLMQIADESGISEKPAK